MISGHGNIESAVKAIKLGAFDFVEKPLSLEKTVLVIGNAVRQSRLEAENRALRAHVDRRLTMVGESYVMAQLREQVAMAAPTNGRVLIYGENGTGKELVARTIHALSRRRGGPFVEVNCAAIPEELIESELFGHVKGRVHRRDAGSARQVRARRRRDALPRRNRRHEPEDAGQGAARAAGAGRRTGRRRGQRARRRARARRDEQGSSDRDPRVALSRGSYFRLNVIPIFVPPLRDRADDVPRLAEYFMSELAREYGRRRKTFDPQAMSTLQRYRWPGNVREMRNVLERLMIMVPGDTIANSDLSFLDGADERGAAARAPCPVPLHEARDAFERDYILRALAGQQGNISRTADALGVERSNLYRKMRSFGIAPARRVDRKRTA